MECAFCQDPLEIGEDLFEYSPDGTRITDRIYFHGLDYPCVVEWIREQKDNSSSALEAKADIQAYIKKYQEFKSEQ